MASVVDICNLALARLGDAATVASIDPPEGSIEAQHCARFYPVARDAMLEGHEWKFATRRAVLAQLSVDSFNWQYAYAEPAGAIKILSVLPVDSGSEAESANYITESSSDGAPMIFTDLPDATVRYIARVTDTTKFSPLFTDALAWLLASYLAGPVLKGDTGAAAAKSSYATFKTVLGQATFSDANQQQVTVERNPGWISGR